MNKNIAKLLLTGVLSLVFTLAASANDDISIKGLDPKGLPFNKVIKVDSDYTNSILYDRAVEGDMCFISCNKYNGVTSKWSNFYVDLQPFENFCMFWTGCASQYPLPSSEVRLKVNDSVWTLKMLDPDNNRYYLPLQARKAIGLKSGNISLEIAGVKMPVYRIGENNVSLIAEVVNQNQEKQLPLGTGVPRGKEERLIELKALFDKGLISPVEYTNTRLKIIEGN
jgi:hypothetical protein